MTFLHPVPRLRRLLVLSLLLACTVPSAGVSLETASAATSSLAVSKWPDRAISQSLAGTSYVQPAEIYVFTQPARSVTSVRFYVDDPTMNAASSRIDSSAPFDFNGTASNGSAVPLDVGSLTTGSHTITAAIKKSSGSTQVLSSKFDVLASSPTPTPSTTTSDTTVTTSTSPTLVYQDDFNGTTLNTTYWSPYYSAGHAGNGLRRPSAFTLDGDGNLVVTAQMIDGVIVSGGMSNKLNYAYGRYEFRVRTEPDPTGTTSGVVLTWPQSNLSHPDGENDIYETGHDVNTRSPFHTFIHYGALAPGYQYHYQQNADASQWHTMVMDWTASAIKVYRDGVLVWTLTDALAIPDVAHHMCIQLDAMVTRTLTQPVHMYVDYVKIYKFA